ncbi:cation diffusion facilitator family transporter, partial [Klebsiella pneumoniae]|nr:cation diffusion facilitator family transporter [Klebsiella pneumoniae]
LKTLAYLVTGSVALLSDALESIINVAASLAALAALHISAQPADTNHPYGHHKAEYISAVVEGVLVVLAAFTILREAYHGFLDPRLPDQPVKGMLLNG